jgi:mannose-1-phosphate guanylyltransferase
MNHAVIMAGGSGTRLWPLSRENHPKQSLRLTGERTLFQESVYRILPLFPSEQIWVVASPELTGLLYEQVPELCRENFIYEPEGRGTAPAIGLAAIHLEHKDPEAIMTILTADHHIADLERFRSVLVGAEALARQGYLVTLGIKPTGPSTGYGYIEHDRLSNDIGGFSAFHVLRFIEKPDKETAQKMVAAGRFSWNSGMFIWRVDRILEEFSRQMPGFHTQLRKIRQVLDEPDFPHTLAAIWSEIEKETIDYGVMEGASEIMVIPVEMGWTDVGSWENLVELLPTDDSGNTTIGEHFEIDTANTLLYGDKRLLATIGLNNMIVVDTDDVILICPKERAQEVRQLVHQLKKQGKTRWL